MSPLPLRRYRAERLLRREFEGRREQVLRVVRARLRSDGLQLDADDLEACYAQAWQGLYTALLAGREVANPVGWLTVVTFRRAIDEHRARARAAARATGVGGEHLPAPAGTDGERSRAPAAERDLAAELDDRARLRQLFEGLHGRLSARECEACGTTLHGACAEDHGRCTSLACGGELGARQVASRFGDFVTLWRKSSLGRSERCRVHMSDRPSLTGASLAAETGESPDASCR